MKKTLFCHHYIIKLSRRKKLFRTFSFLCIMFCITINIKDKFFPSLFLFLLLLLQPLVKKRISCAQVIFLYAVFWLTIELTILSHWTSERKEIERNRTTTGQKWLFVEKYFNHFYFFLYDLCPFDWIGWFDKEKVF